MSKTLIAYFSYTGNTRKIAERMKEKIECDILEIIPKEKYKGNYNSVVSQGQNEVNMDFRPELESINVNLNDYSTVVLCSPIWWYTLVPVIKSFLGRYDLKGKKIIPLITNGGYGLGHSMADLKKLCPDSRIEKCLEVPFETDEMQLPATQIDQWILKFDL